MLLTEFTMISIHGTENASATADIITNEALFRLKHNLVIPMICGHNFDEYFEDMIGDTITIKKPYYAKATKGAKLKINPMIDKTVSLSVNERWHVALKGNDVDYTLSIVDYSKRYLNSAAEELAYHYDEAGGIEFHNSFFRLHIPTVGQGIDLKMSQNIRAQATEVAIPHNRNCYALLSPTECAEIQHAMLPLNNEQLVWDAITDAFMGKLAQWKVMSSVHIPNYKVAGLATTAAPKIVGANQRGSSMLTSGWATGDVVTKVLNKGQIISFAGVGEIQPRGTRRPTGRLATFVVTADVMTGNGGTATIPIYPEINAGSSTLDTVPNPVMLSYEGEAKLNLDASAFQTVSNTPPAGAIITVYGRKTGSGKSADPVEYRQGFYFNTDAVEYANIALLNPKSAVAHGRKRDDETGAIISYVSDFDITENSEIDRLDIYFGVKNIYPELGIRAIFGEVTAF